MKRLLLLLITGVLLCLHEPVRASHLKGGEITWECYGAGQYIFWLKMYRDCNGINLGNVQQLNSTAPGHATIPLIQVQGNDLTPTGCGNTCNNPNGFTGATEEFIYKSNPITLNGTPPAGGWIFYWDFECCRNNTLNINNTGTMALRSIMYPFAPIGNTNPCFDNSPRFVIAPTSFLCIGYDFTYNPVGVDDDYDSLSYGFDYPWDALNSPMTYVNTAPPGPFSVNSPMPGNPTINPITGEFNIFPQSPQALQGNYTMVTRVDAWRCNIKIASVFREVQVSLSANCTPVCGSTGTTQNHPPNIFPAPFINPGTGLLTDFRDTVVVGDTVQFTLSVSEFEYQVPLCWPPQLFYIDAYGAAFDSGSVAPYINCDRPPCAYLDTATPAGPYLQGKEITFTWMPTCAHRGGGALGSAPASCAIAGNLYPFVIKAYDDNCPAPGINYYSFQVLVTDPDTLDAPGLRCASVDSAGDVTLSWEKPWPIDSFNTFYSYEIYRATTRNGPYTLIDSVLDYDTLSYKDVMVDGQQQSYFYYMMTKCGCDSNTLSRASDTLQTIDLNATLAGNTVTLNWNHMVANLATDFPPHAIPKYYVERRSITQSAWTFVDTLVTVDSLLDIIPLGCTDTIIYRVYVKDSSECVSLSSLDTVWTSGTPPEPPLLRCISVITPGGQIKLDWIIPAPADTGQDFGGYFIYSGNALAGPYTLRDSVLPYLTNTWTDAAANAYMATQFYYVKTRDNCGMTYSLPSDTLQPIILSVNQVGTNAVLTWNAPHTPAFASYSAYMIYKENLPHTVPPTYQLLTSIANNAPLTYNDAVSVCADSITYYVTLADNTPGLNCTMFSTYDGDSLFSPSPVINPPSLRCLSVDAAGNVTLEWVAPAGLPGYFDSYEIYHATNIAGPYTLVTTIPAQATLLYAHNVGGAANSAPQYYYLKTKAGCDAGTVQTSVAGNTLATIYLTTTNPVTNADPGIGELDWTDMPLLTTSGQYVTNSTYNAGSAWSAFGSPTSSLTANQDINDCNIPLQHQITLTDASGCSSESNIYSNTFTYLGNIVPAPDLRCVSVLASGQVELQWETPANSDDFNEYEIWRDNVLIDSISNFASIVYQDLTANANNQSHAYYIVSQSGCSGQENSTPSTTLNSIYLTTTNPVTTANPGIGQLDWNGLPLLATSGQYTTLSTYNAGGAWGPFGSPTSSLTANQDIFDCNIPLQHQITVSDASGCSSESNIYSNTFTYIGNIVPAPDLRCVSVLPSGQVELEWLTPGGSNAEFNEFEIWRDNVLIDSISAFGIILYTDATANANNQSHSYYIVSQSGCSGQSNSTPSTTLNSIYLTTTNPVTSANPGIGQLDWNALPLIASSGQYTTHSTYNAGGAWGSFGSPTTSLTANQDIIDCNIPLQHQVTVSDASGCTSESNIYSNTFTYIGNIVAAPDLRCVSVLASGQVQLEGLAPGGSTAEFNEFEIWRDNVLIDSISTFGNILYQDISANANNQSYAYYIVSQSGCSGQENSTPSVMLNSIYLTTTNPSQNSDPGIGQLDWNGLPLMASSGQYVTNSNYNAGSAWSVFGSPTASLTADQDINDCNIPLQHQITVSDASGCSSESNIQSGTFTYLGNVVENVSLRCASVNDDGTVELTWETPTSSSDEFNEYEIWREGVLIDSVNVFAQPNYLDLNVNAHTQSYGYYVVSQSGCTGQVYSISDYDTLHTIKVNVININNDGIAEISWNHLHQPDLPTASGSYDVYKKYPASTGNWQLLSTTTLPLVYDTITICDDSIAYRVITSDAAGCTSQSSFDGDRFGDETKPQAPVMESVSVNPDNSGAIHITWFPSTSSDAVGYNVYRFNTTNYTLLGTVTSGLSYDIIEPNVESTIYNYAVAAFDSCTNLGAIGGNLNTINFTAKLDICRSAIDVKWNPYLVTGGVAFYNVYVSQNGGSFILLATVPGTAVSYSHTGLVDDSEYCYYVEASGNTVTHKATSNSDCEVADLLTLPTFSYLKTATVRDVRRVYVEAYVDNAAGVDVSKYKLQRSQSLGGPFTTVGVVNFNNLPIISFTDYTARTDEGSYYYRVVTVDSCGNNVLISNLGRTIFISGRPEFNLVNKLAWNDYDGWLGNIRDYDLYRSVDGVWDPTPLNRLAYGLNNYEDNVGEIYQTSGRFCYKIQGYEGLGNPYGFTDSSMSNEFCLIQEPHLFVPNAFTPGGKNPEFKPSFIYMDPKNYQFLVFTRWGEKIFETTDPKVGWDGTIKGTISEQATYMYLIRMHGTNGQILEKSGRVTLLR